MQFNFTRVLRNCLGLLVFIYGSQLLAAREDLSLAEDRSFDNVIIFGDSLSDDKNLFTRSYHSVPLPPYWRGRFSNGPVWGEVAFKSLGIPVKNYAVAGMMTSMPFSLSLAESYQQTIYLIFREFFTLDFNKLIHLYLFDSRYDRDAIGRNLHILFVGNVNYLTVADLKKFKDSYTQGDLTVLQQYAKETVEELKGNIKRLYAAGARQFVIKNLPDYKKMPNDDPAITYLPGILGAFGVLHNEALEMAMAELKEAHPDANFSLFNTFDTFNKIFENPPAYGFSVTDSSCYLGGWTKKEGREKFKVCANPDSYVFFDPYHPSRKAHCFISWGLLNYLSEEQFVTTSVKSEQEMISICNNDLDAAASLL